MRKRTYKNLHLICISSPLKFPRIPMLQIAFFSLIQTWIHYIHKESIKIIVNISSNIHTKKSGTRCFHEYFVWKSCCWWLLLCGWIHGEFKDIFWRTDINIQLVVISGQTRLCVMSLFATRRMSNSRHLLFLPQCPCPPSLKRWRGWRPSATAATASVWADWPSTDTWRRWRPCAASGSSSTWSWRGRTNR